MNNQTMNGKEILTKEFDLETERLEEELKVLVEIWISRYDGCATCSSNMLEVIEGNCEDPKCGECEVHNRRQHPLRIKYIRAGGNDKHVSLDPKIQELEDVLIERMEAKLRAFECKHICDPTPEVNVLYIEYEREDNYPTY